MVQVASTGSWFHHVHDEIFFLLDVLAPTKWLPPVSRQYVQRGHTNTLFNRCAFPFSSVDSEQRFGPPNETQPYKHLSIVL